MDLLANEFADQERALKDSLSERRRLVLQDKKLMLFRKLMGDASRQDAELTEHIARGFDLTGVLPGSNVFKTERYGQQQSHAKNRCVADLAVSSLVRRFRSRRTTVLGNFERS